MSWQWTVFTLPLSLGLVLLCLLSGYLFRRWRRDDAVPGIGLATALVACIAVTLGFYVLEVSAAGFGSKVAFNRLQYLGLAPLSAFLLAYVLVYVGRGDVLTRRTYAAIFSPVLLTLLVVFTDGLHGQFWTDLSVIDAGRFVMLENDHGPAYFGFLAYTYAYCAASLGLLARASLDARGSHRWQIGGMVVGAGAPLLGGVVYVLGFVPPEYPTASYVGFLVTAVAFSWPVFRHDLFKIVPIANRTVVEQLDEGVLVCNDDGVVVSANAAAATLLDRDRGSIVGSDCSTVLSPVADRLGVGATGAEPKSVSLGDRVVDVSVTVLTQSGQRVGRLVRLADVTERHDRERRLRRQNAYLDEFAGVVSHDIATPLSVIESRARLIELTDDPEHVADIYASTERIRSLMDDLLELARQGKEIDEVEPVALEAVVEAAWRSVDASEATLTVRSSATLVASRSRLGQLLENLLRNAVTHGPPADSSDARRGRREGSSGRESVTDGGPGHAQDRAISIRVGALPDGFYLEDDGVGIPEEDRSRVFDQGYTSVPGGTGLGLAIVSRIVEAHGWSIDVTESPEGGARFEVTGVETVSAGETGSSS